MCDYSSSRGICAGGVEAANGDTTRCTNASISSSVRRPSNTATCWCVCVCVCVCVCLCLCVSVCVCASVCLCASICLSASLNLSTSHLAPLLVEKDLRIPGNPLVVADGRVFRAVNLCDCHVLCASVFLHQRSPGLRHTLAVRAPVTNTNSNHSFTHVNAQVLPSPRLRTHRRQATYHGT